MDKYLEQVKKGAAFLDYKMPGWDDKISLEALKMNDPDRCILGQLYDGDRLGIDRFTTAFSAVSRSLGLSEFDRVDNGFLLEDFLYSAEYITLGNTWSNLILQRRFDKVK